MVLFEEELYILVQNVRGLHISLPYSDYYTILGVLLLQTGG